MARYALIKDGKIVNFIAAEPGFKHPDGEMIHTSLLTVKYAKKMGMPIASDDSSVVEAYKNKKPVIVGLLNEYGIFELSKIKKLPSGLLLPTSGTTGDQKVTCIPWDVMEARSDAWVKLFGDLTGPVWYTVTWKHLLGWASSKFTMVKEGIKCYSGTERPSENCQIVLGFPDDLEMLLGKGLIHDNETMMLLGKPASYNQILGFCQSGRLVIDQYASSEAGVMAMTTYKKTENGSISASSKLAEGVSIGPAGTIVVKGKCLAKSYLHGPIQVNNDVFDTRDLVSVNSDGVIKITGRRKN